MTCSYGSIKLMWCDLCLIIWDLIFICLIIYVDYLGYSSPFKFTLNLCAISFLFVQVGDHLLTLGYIKLQKRFYA